MLTETEHEILPQFVAPEEDKICRLVENQALLGTAEYINVIPALKPFNR